MPNCKKTISPYQGDVTDGSVEYYDFEWGTASVQPTTEITAKENVSEETPCGCEKEEVTQPDCGCNDVTENPPCGCGEGSKKVAQQEPFRAPEVLPTQADENSYEIVNA